MILYLLRHGQALPGTPDAGRVLSPAGESEVSALAARMKEDNHLPEKIIASPYRRAQQTAGLVCQGLGRPEKFQTSDLFTPEASIEAALKELDKAKDESLLIVSHMPFLGDFMAMLLDEPNPYPFSTAGLACLDVDAFVPGGATLLWFHG